MYILGIDPALNVTGYGLIKAADNDELVLVEAGVVKSSRKHSLPQRLYCIYSEILNLIDKYKPEILVLEKVFSHYKYPATVISISYARGLICLLCGQKNIEFYEYSATRVKKALTGCGHAPKEQMRKTIFNTLNLKSSFSYLDATDALALAVAHYRLNRTGACIALAGSQAGGRKNRKKAFVV